MYRVRAAGIHLEFHGEMAPLPSIGEDLVVLAGDIAIGVDGIRWAKRAFAGRPVIYVLGNQEFYGGDFASTIREARAAVEGSNVHLLENDAIEFQGYRILGCTLWTDFECYGVESRTKAPASPRLST